MNLSDATPGMRVQFTPRNESGEPKERGEVSSVNEKYVFVKFDYAVKKHGLDGTTAQACRPEDLTKLVRKTK